MLELIPRPQFRLVLPEKLLREGFLVTFSEAWPGTFDHVKGKTFQIEAVNQVKYQYGWIIPGDDYKDIDLSNQTDGLNLYPTNERSLYEITLGFKPGNFLVQVFVPSDKPLSRLEQPSMIPDVTSATLRYLGTIRPEDSPADDHRLFMYIPADLEPIILRLFVQPGVDYEKCVFDFMINKCHLTELAKPTEQQRAKATLIRYYEELRWA